MRERGNASGRWQAWQKTRFATSVPQPVDLFLTATQLVIAFAFCRFITVLFSRVGYRGVRVVPRVFRRVFFAGFFDIRRA